MPDENDKHTGPKAPAQNAPGPSNPRPNYAPQEGNPLAGPQQNPVPGPQQNPLAGPQQNPYPAPQQNPSQNPAQNSAAGLQWGQTGQSPDLFSSVPGYQPHSFGQPVTQPVVNTSFAQEQLANLAVQTGAAPIQPQGFGEPIIEPTAQPIPHVYGQLQPGQMPQHMPQPAQMHQPAQIPQPGLIHQPGQIAHPGLIRSKCLNLVTQHSRLRCQRRYRSLVISLSQLRCRSRCHSLVISHSQHRDCQHHLLRYHNSSSRQSHLRSKSQ